MKENILNIGLILITIQQEIEKSIDTIYFAPQTALSGFLYGLFHNKDTADQTALDAVLRRRYERYRLARAITKVRQATLNILNRSQDRMFSDADLKRMILECDFKALKIQIEHEKTTSTCERERLSLQNQKEAVEQLETLSFSMRKIIAEIKHGDESDLLHQSTHSFKTEKDEIKKLANLLFDKQLIDGDFEVFDFIISLFNQGDKKEFFLPNPKDLNKKIFKYFAELGKTLRNLMIIQSIKDNKLLNLIIGIVGLIILIPMYILLGATKTLKSIFVGTFDVVKMLLLGIYMSINKDTQKDKIDLLIMDLKSPLNEIKSIYKCVFASISRDIEQWEHTGGKNSLMRVIEKLIYELLTKINLNYKSLINDESIEAKDIKDARELVVKIDDPNQHEDKEKNLQKLHDIFENTQAIPFFEISNSLQHIHTLGETIRIFVQRSAFTAAHNFTDYVIGRSDSKHDLVIA